MYTDILTDRSKSLANPGPSGFPGEPDPAPQTGQQAIIPPQVYIVVLNWNGWRDTIECLESIFRLTYSRFRLIVCDNASADGSLDRIEEWANGKMSAVGEQSALGRFVFPPVPKPLAYVRFSAASSSKPGLTGAPPLTLLETGANLGFAGGNNVGIRYALAGGDCDYVWLLNNDTVVEPEALTAMVRMAEADQRLGMCGSLLRGYEPPHAVQTLGRTYSPLTGRTRPIQEATPADNRSLQEYVIEGASMLVRRSFLEQVGLLEESYFLFFEELDWTMRARPHFKAGYAPESVVYHKLGASIGSSHNRGARSTLSDFYQARNRLLFTRRYHGWFFISVFAAVGVSAVHRLVIGRPRNALAILRGMMASFSAQKARGRS